MRVFNLGTHLQRPFFQTDVQTYGKNMEGSFRRKPLLMQKPDLCFTRGSPDQLRAPRGGEQRPGAHLFRLPLPSPPSGGGQPGLQAFICCEAVLSSCWILAFRLSTTHFELCLRRGRKKPGVVFSLRGKAAVVTVSSLLWQVAVHVGFSADNPILCLVSPPPPQAPPLLR